MIAMPLTLADLESKAPAPKAAEVVASIRNSHHLLARMVAEGRKSGDIQAITGYSGTHISRLSADPAFIELVEHYKNSVQAEYVSVHAQIAELGGDVVQEIRERLHTAPEEFTVAQLNDLAKTMLDRSGHGPTKTVNSTAVSVQVTSNDLARIRAQAQAQKGEVKRIGGNTDPVPETPASPDRGIDISGTIDLTPLVHSEAEQKGITGPGNSLREVGGQVTPDRVR